MNAAEVTRTAAQAALLAALAEHLVAHPHLYPVDIIPGWRERPARLQVARGDDALLAWGDSLDVTQWRVDRPRGHYGSDHVYLRADVVIGGQDAALFGVARQLQHTDYRDGELVAAGDLR